MKIAQVKLKHLVIYKGWKMAWRNIFSVAFIALIFITHFFSASLNENVVYFFNILIILTFFVAVYLSLKQAFQKSESRVQVFKLAKSVFFYGIVLSVLFAVIVGTTLQFSMMHN